jgi:hypothetical protein
VLVVMPQAKLTLEPGTVIWFEQLGIIVRGELQVLGTAEKPVELGRLGDKPWKGVFFDHSRGANILQHCNVSGAQYGLRAIASELAIKYCQFRDNQWAMVVESGSAEVRRSLFRTSAKTGVAARDANLKLSESIITENGSGGVLLEKTRATITSNNIANNGRWQLKNINGKGLVSADQNWWGSKHPTEIEILGSVTVGRTLGKPLDFSAEPQSP